MTSGKTHVAKQGRLENRLEEMVSEPFNETSSASGTVVRERDCNREKMYPSQGDKIK